MSTTKEVALLLQAQSVCCKKNSWICFWLGKYFETLEALIWLIWFGMLIRADQSWTTETFTTGTWWFGGFGDQGCRDNLKKQVITLLPSELWWTESYCHIQTGAVETSSLLVIFWLFPEEQSLRNHCKVLLAEPQWIVTIPVHHINHNKAKVSLSDDK